jgi:photosystem II stability/assembly factor-like uncharacterized protein
MSPPLRRLAFALAVWLAAHAAYGQAWERIGADGGSVCALASAPSRPSVVYAGSADFGGVYRSADRGQSWRFAGAGLGLRPACSLAVDPRSPAHLWAVAAGQLFATDDGGSSWHPLGGPEADDYLLSITAHPTIAGRLLLATTRKVWRSENGGETWVSSARGLPGSRVETLIVDSSRPDHVFAGTFSGVYRSLDGGRTWSSRNAGLPVGLRIVRALALDVRDGRTLYAALHPGGFFRSLDGGGSWRALETPWPSANISLLAVSKDGVYAGTSGGLYRSRDRGRTFPPELVRLHGQRIQSWIAPPYGTLTGAERGVYRSLDGISWSSSNDGLRARLLSHLAIDPQQPSRWYVFDGHQNVLRSLNGGATWRRAGESPLFVPFAPFASLLTVDAFSSRVYGGVLGGLAWSDDGGLGWRFALTSSCSAALRVLPDSRRGRIFVYSPTLLAGCGPAPTRCSDFRSDDDGATFSCARDALPVLASYLAFDPMSGNLFASSPAGLHRSSDGGDTWALTDLHDPLPNQLITSPAQPGLMFATAIASDLTTIYRSADGGATWAVSGVTASTLGEILADPLDSGRLYALVNVGVSLSADAGATWQPLGTGAEEVFINGLAFDPREADFLYATSTGGGLLRLHLDR